MSTLSLDSLGALGVPILISAVIAALLGVALLGALLLGVLRRVDAVEADLGVLGHEAVEVSEGGAPCIGCFHATENRWGRMVCVNPDCRWFWTSQAVARR